jgi:hypothetical protein
MRLLLPSDIESKNMEIFFSKPNRIVKKIDAINEQTESAVLNSLVDELNLKFGTDLAELAGPPHAESDLETEKGLYVVAGGSQAGRLASQLDEMGLKVVDLSVPSASRKPT